MVPKFTSRRGAHELNSVIHSGISSVYPTFTIASAATNQGQPLGTFGGWSLIVQFNRNPIRHPPTLTPVKEAAVCCHLTKLTRLGTLLHLHFCVFYKPVTLATPLYTIWERPVGASLLYFPPTGRLCNGYPLCPWSTSFRRTDGKLFGVMPWPRGGDFSTGHTFALTVFWWVRLGFCLFAGITTRAPPSFWEGATSPRGKGSTSNFFRPFLLLSGN